METSNPARGRSGSRPPAGVPGVPLDQIRNEVFALAREAVPSRARTAPVRRAARRGACPRRGHVIEMLTGEGKTLAAMMPAALNALTGRGVHVLTFNDYLARRDAEWMGPVYRLPWAVGRLRPAGHAARRAAARLPRGRHLRDREGGRLRPPARSARRGRRATRAPAVPLRARGRGRLAADRRGARPARHRRQVEREVSRAPARRARRVARPGSTSTPTSTGATSS